MATFALAPGLVADDEIIDYSIYDNKKVYKSATAPLPHEFDCEQTNLRLFLSEVDFRSDQYSWGQVLNIPENVEDDDTKKHLLVREYGVVTLEQVRAFVATYCGEETRLAQDDSQLFHCLMASLTVEGKNKILLHKSDWTIPSDDGSEPFKSGTALLKVIVRESHIDTNATVLSIREELSQLDVHMEAFGSDVKKFNEYVTSQLEALTARGEKTLDILAHLFKGYEAVSDSTFRDYIQQKKDAYQEGGQMSYKSLMALALTKYQVLVQTKKWNAPTAEEEKLIALRAELNSKVKKLQQKRKRGNEDQDGLNINTPTNDKGPKQKRKKGKKPEWMLEPPKEGAASQKTVNGKLYHWCKKHKAWVRHLPSECEGKGYIPKSLPKKAKNNGNKDDPTNKVNKALAALQDDDSDDE